MSRLHAVMGLPHAQARRLAVPAIASNVTVPVVGLIDTAALGHASDATNLGAVGLGAAVIASAFWIVSFLRPGTTALVGAALGAGDRDAAVAHLRRAVTLAAVLGASWLALQWWIAPPLTRLLAGDSDAAGVATEYVLIRGISMPAVLVTLAIAGYFIGAHDTRSPLIVAATIAGANVAGDLVAVVWLGHGARGAAWATVAAELIGVAVALLLVRRRRGAGGWRVLAPSRGVGSRGAWLSLMRMNGWLVVRSALLMSAVTAVASLGSRIDATALAANAIILQMMYLSSYALDGYATAAEAMAAQRIGARDVTGLHRSVAATSIVAAALAVAMSLAFAAGREFTIGALTDLAPVADATRAVWWAAVAIPVVSGAAWMLDGVFLGTARARDMAASMAASALGVFFPLIAWALATGSLTQTVVWTAFLGLNVTRALSLGLRYAWLSREGGGRWLR